MADSGKKLEQRGAKINYPTVGRLATKLPRNPIQRLQLREVLYLLKTAVGVCFQLIIRGVYAP